MDGPGRVRLLAGLGTALIAVSSAAVVILLAAPLHPLWIACGRVAVTAVALALLAPRALGTMVARLRDTPQLRGRTLAAGALLALHFGAWIGSLQLTSVLRSMALVATQPLWAGLFGRLIGDRAPLRLYAGALVAVVGTAVMVQSEPGGLTDGSGPSVVGDVLAVVGAAAAAAYLVAGRSVGDAVPLRGYLSVIHIGAAAILGAVAMAIGAGPIAVPHAIAALVYLGVVPGAIGHGLINWAVRKLPVHVVSLVILLEPLGAAGLAWVVLGQDVGAYEAIGAGILLCGVGVGLPREPRQRE